MVGLAVLPKNSPQIIRLLAMERLPLLLWEAGRCPHVPPTCPRTGNILRF